MKNFLGWLFWFALFVVLLVGMDRYLMGTRSEAPLVSEIQEFYRDFRGRLATLWAGGEDDVAKVIGESAEPARPPDPQPTPATPHADPRFLYVDSGGKLHFADSLDEVPPPYREEAEPLER